MKTYDELKVELHEELKKDGSSNADRLADRLAFIDFKLQFTGYVKRSEIGEVFNIADAASSKVLAEYSKRCASNIEYDSSKKVNAIVRESFKPLLQLDAEKALGMLANGFNKNKLSDTSNTLITYQRIDEVPGKLSPECVSKITRAISGGYSISCKYYSDSSDNLDTRILVPLAIMYDGITWMFRAFYRDDPKGIYYRNFHFTRVDEVKELFVSKENMRQVNEELSQDKEWNSKIPLSLRLHEDRSPKEKDKIRQDFGFTSNQDEIMIPIRSAFLWILTRKWFIDDRSEEQKSLDNEALNSGELKYKKYFKFELLNKETVDFLKSNL